MVPEAELQQTGAGLAPASAGWLTLNARDARWFHGSGRDSLPLTGCAEFEAETRQFQKDGPWGYYTVDEAARRHNACPAEETQDTEAAYAHLPPRQPSRYRDGLLPD